MPNEQSTKIRCQSIITDIEQAFNEINQPRVTADLEWEWDAKHQVLLTHFARNFSQSILEQLENNFADAWHSKNMNRAPKALKCALNDYGKLTKKQRIFTLSKQDESEGIIAIWWPWGHGNTYSLRIGLLDVSYELTNDINQTWWQTLFSKGK